ncbi:MAG: glutathione S-transferase family protein [Roseiarcus sp.]
MITLYKFGPGFGLPDPSPFVTKAELLLKIAGLDYDIDLKGFGKAPKGKLPYIRDDGETIADSTFIRLHIERKYGFDFDAGLSAAEKGFAWGLEKMCEDHLYWIMVDARWLDDGNFARGPAKFFDAAPAPIRPVVKAYVRRGLKRTLHGQGLGRHSAEERAELGRRDLEALAAILGDKPYLFGDAPRGVDATVGAFVMGCLAKIFVTPLRAAAEGNANLVAYAKRLTKRYYPDFAA